MQTRLSHISTLPYFVLHRVHFTLTLLVPYTLDMNSTAATHMYDDLTAMCKIAFK